jgi:hypothetical protein
MKQPHIRTDGLISSNLTWILSRCPRLYIIYSNVDRKSILMMILANDRPPFFITPPLRKTWPIMIKIPSHLPMVIQALAGEPRPLINMKEITGPSTSRTGHGVRTRQYNFPVTTDITERTSGRPSRFSSIYHAFIYISRLAYTYSTCRLHNSS